MALEETVSRHLLTPWQIARALRGIDSRVPSKAGCGKAAWRHSGARLTTQLIAQDGLSLVRQLYDKLK